MQVVEQAHYLLRTYLLTVLRTDYKPLTGDTIKSTYYLVSIGLGLSLLNTYKASRWLLG